APDVDALLDRALGGQRLRVQERLAGRGARECPGVGDRVATDVEDAAAGQVRVEQSTGGPAGGERERGVDVHQLADGAVADQLQHLPGLRVEAVHVGLD